MPYRMFRFAASFRQPHVAIRGLVIAVTVGIVAFTFTLQYLPLPGSPPPPHWLAYRISFLAEFTFLFTYVVVRLFMAGIGEPPIAKYRMRLLAVAVAGRPVPVVVAALALTGTTTALVTEAITVAMGFLFLLALVLPSFVRVALSRRADLEFREAVSELVSAGDSKDVGDRLLPHVCALVGASDGRQFLTPRRHGRGPLPGVGQRRGRRRMGPRPRGRQRPRRAAPDHRAHP